MDFYLTDEELYLVQRSLQHTDETDCDCFTERERIKINRTQLKIANLIDMNSDNTEMEDFVREFGEL